MAARGQNGWPADRPTDRTSCALCGHQTSRQVQDDPTDTPPNKQALGRGSATEDDLNFKD